MHQILAHGWQPAMSKDLMHVTSVPGCSFPCQPMTIDRRGDLIQSTCMQDSAIMAGGQP